MINFFLSELANIISIFPLALCLVLLYNFLILPSKNLVDLILLLVILITNTIVRSLKRLPYPKSWHSYTMRPEGASGCDYLSRKGMCKPGTPGMPSGHMASVSLFSVFMILSKIYSSEGLKFKFDDMMFLIINLGLIILTAFARYYKKCHNGLQILLGTIFGSVVGIITFFALQKINIVRKFDKLIDTRS